jgi:beta-glucosidase
MTTQMSGERSQLAALPLEDKVRLLTGADSWRIPGCDALGLRPMVTSDGPSGVRGTTLDESNPSSCLPCPSALGATWDPELVREVAAALGAEARGKGVDILLAPTINLMRTPLAGRGFECFSEDPELTARIAVAYVTGVQSAGVAATVKHYVGNDSETERWTYDARIAEQVLRELYLVPFEASVREGGAALVMAAYNVVNGSRMTEHAMLLRAVLKGEWGFAGLVTSDWDATRSTVPTAVGGLDLAMPGPNRYWGPALADAVRAGEVPEEMVDDKVTRLLAVARRVGALGEAATVTAAGSASLDPAAPRSAGLDPAAPPNGADRPAPPALVPAALLRRAVTGSLVLLHNDGALLPLDAGDVRRVAVVGPNALHPVIQGGGSARVIPASAPAPVQALREAFGAEVTVTSAPGCWTWQSVPEPSRGSITDPVTGEPGARLEFATADGQVFAAEHRAATALAWWDGLPPGVGWGESGIIRLRAAFRAETGGPYLLGAAGVGQLTITVNGTVAAQGETRVPADPVETMTRPGEIRGQVTLPGGQDAAVTVEFRPAAACQGPVALRLGVTPSADEQTLMAEAVEAAAAADTAIVMVGSAETSESEGYDRDTLALPGRQDELVRRVAAVCPRTVVVVNAGMPVLMPWAGLAGALIYAWLPGQAIGEALADVLLGLAEPGGRLPVTLPAAEADCPVLHALPTDGRLEYAEGLLIGYRGYDAAGIAPMYPFGHGLGYTAWDYESLSGPAGALAPGTDAQLRVRVRNCGSRPGREIVQAYVTGAQSSAGPDPAAPPNGRRPVRVLGAFGGVIAAPGETAEVTLRVPARIFAVFDEETGRWAWPPGEFTVQVGRSSRDLRLSATVRSG